MCTAGRVEAAARLAVGLLLVLVTAGCGHGSGGATSAAPPATTVDPPASTAGSSAAGTSTVTGVTIAPGATTGGPALLVTPRCQPSDVEVSLDIQPRSGSDAATWTRALIVVTTDSAAPCRLEGFAQVRSVQGLLVKPVVVQWVATGRDDEAVTVRTGASGFAAVSWLSGPACPQVGGFEVVLPGDRSEAKVELVGAVGSRRVVAVCDGTAELGPFVASAAVADAEQLMAKSR